MSEDMVELEANIEMLCAGIINDARPELERLRQLAERYRDRPEVHQEYMERYADLHRRTVERVAATRQPLVDLAMLEPMPPLMIDAALNQKGVEG